MRPSSIIHLHSYLQAHRTLISNQVLPDIETYLGLKQERHDQLTRRYERLERRTDALTNACTPRARKLLADYERVAEQHARSEEELDDLENLVLEPLRELEAMLSTLVA